jgi:hypothetical protein
MCTLGYILFFLILFAAPLLMLVASPALVLVASAISILPPRQSLRAGKVYAGLFGGICAGLFIFGDASLISSLFHCSYNWLIALGMLLSVLASPKIQNARYAIPAEVIIVLGLSYWLLW